MSSARRSVPGARQRGTTGQRAGAVTDAPGASCAVWSRPLRRSLRSKPRLRENGETTVAAVDRGQSARTTVNRGISPAASRRHKLAESAFPGGITGEAERESDSVSICPQAGRQWASVCKVARPCPRPD